MSIVQTILDNPEWILFPTLFLAVFLGVIAVAGLRRSPRSMGERLSDARKAPTDAGGGTVSLRQKDPDTRAHRILKGIQKHAIITNEDELSAIRLKMVQAGYMGEAAVRVYYILRVVLAVFLPVIFLLVGPSYLSDMPLTNTLGIALGLCVVGLWLPYRSVTSRIESRQRAISNGFPDTLDMLVICVEAGLGLDSAIARVASEMARSHPILAEQMSLISLELRAGKPRDEALRNFASRTGVDDINTFVVLLIQSEALGADLAYTLTVQADEMRNTRMMRAEEAAHKLPVKLSMPLVGCILPAMFAVVLGPGIISIIRNVLPHLGGG